jgi:serine/arginine repetitive matrix protein 1
MDVDQPSTGPELKIKGQAEIERRKSKWENETDDRESKDDLERRENELKEKALRNKVLRSRKAE